MMTLVFVVPCPLVPMAPALARPPFHGDGWILEKKLDGRRMLGYEVREWKPDSSSR